VTPHDSTIDVPEYLAFGDLAVDSVARIEHFPQADEKLWVEPAGDFPGGMMGNAAAAVAALGRSAGVVALVGSDEHGRIVMEGLRERGIDTRFVTEVDAPTFWTLSLTVASGERSLIQFPTSAFGVDWDRLDRGIRGRTRWVHTIAEGGDFVPPLLRQARAAGATTSLDIEFPFVLDLDLASVCPHVEVAFLNAAAAEALGGPEEASKRVQVAGAGTVLVTLGESGALLRRRDGETVPLGVHRVESIDTNGAGDAFAGGYAAGALRGFNETEAAELAAFMAGISTTALGGFGPSLSLDELRALAEAAGRAWWERL
jgi:ribokinase